MKRPWFLTRNDVRSTNIGRRIPSASIRQRFRPRLEALEERWVPSSTQITAFGADQGGGPAVLVFRNGSSGGLQDSLMAFDPAFRGGVRVAVADVNGDGIDDVIAAAGPGGGPEVIVFDGQGLSNGFVTVVAAFMAYDVHFRGGVYVAAADVNHDGFADIITGPGAGGGPNVKVFDGQSIIHGQKVLLANFMAYAPTFSGGVTVAAADVSNNGFSDVITGAGPGGQPQVHVYSGLAMAQGTFNNVSSLITSFDAFAATFSGGVFVAGGDLNGDGFADVIVGAGAGGGPEVIAFNGQNIANGSFIAAADQLLAFFAYSPNFIGGVRVAYDPVTPGIITAPGAGMAPLAGYGFGLTVFNPTFINIFGNFTGGMYVSV
jgi:hypothetical protein